MAQFSRPASDVSAGTWTVSGGAGSLAAQIDETVASNTDLIITTAGGSNETCRIRFSAVVDPLSNTGHVLRFRARRASGFGGYLDCKLYDAAGTLIKTISTNGTITGTQQDFSFTLTSIEADNIVGYTVEVEFIKVANGFNPVIEVAWSEFEVPSPPQTVSALGGTTAQAAVSGGVAVRQARTLTGIGNVTAQAAVSGGVTVRQARTISALGGTVAQASAGVLGVSKWISAETILQDPGAGLDVTLQLEGAHRVTKAVRTFWFSFQGKSTDSADDPPRMIMPPYLTSPGGVGLTLSEDLVFSGASQEDFQEISLRNAQGELDYLKDYTFAGRPLTVRIGGERQPHRGFLPLYTATMRGEPRIGSSAVKVQADSILPGLSEKIPFRRYIGIPVALKMLTATGVASLAYNAAFDLLSYTVVGRFKFDTAPALGVNLFRRSSGANNWCTVQVGTDGKIYYSASTSGVAQVFSSLVSYTNGIVHTVAIGRNRDAEVYLMVDGETIAEGTALGLVDLPAVGIVMGERFDSGGGCLFDVRVYDRFYDDTEILSLIASRVNGNEDDLLALWRFDDAIANTATDYAGGFHATIAGVENTAFAWVQTNEGEPELAGQPMPIVDGRVTHAKMTLIDGGQVTVGSKPRYRMADVPDAINPTKVYARGTLLALNTDYTVLTDPNDGRSYPDKLGVVEMVSSQSEPVSFETNTYSNFSGQTAHPTIDKLIQNLMSRADIASSKLDINSLAGLFQVCPFDAGYVATDPNETFQSRIGALLNGVGAQSRTTRPGLWSAGFLVPPVSPGPFGGPVLEFTAPSQGVHFPGGTGVVTGSHTISGWFISHALDYDPVSSFSGFSGVPPGQSIIAKTDGITSGYDLRVVRHSTPGRGSVVIFHPGLSPQYTSSSGGEIRWGVRYFLMATYDTSTNKRAIYVGETGRPLRKVIEQNIIGGIFSDFAFNGPTVGSLMVGCVSEVSVYGRALSLAEGQTLMNGGGTLAGAVLYAPLSEGYNTTSAKDGVSGLQGTIAGLESSTRWAPRAVFDLRRLVSPRLEVRPMVPAWDITINCANNYGPLADADFASGVAKRDRIAFKRTGLAANSRRKAVKTDCPDARTVALNSSLFFKADAQRLLRNLLYRFDPGREVASLENAGRRSLLLELTDEVWLYANRFGLGAGAAYRVVSFRPKYDALTSDLTLWR